MLRTLIVSHNMKRQILFIIVLFFSFTGNAQLPEQLYFKHLTPNDGLTQGTIMDIFTDSKGFVWMTGLDGINRFDGLRCLANEEIAPGLGNVGRIDGIKEDQQGNIWFGYVYGIIKYSYATNRFTKIILPEPDKENIGKSYTYNIQDIDTEDNILVWLYAKKGLIYNTRSGIHQFFQLPGDDKIITSRFITFSDPLAKKKTWYCLLRDRDSAHIYQLASHAGQVHWVKGKGFLVQEQFGGSVLMPDENTLIFLSKGRVCRVNLQTGGMNYSEPVEADAVSSEFLLDSKNRLWLSLSNNGIYLLDAGSLAILRRIKYDENNASSISTNYARVFIDQHEMLWVAAMGKGVDYCSLQEKRFRSYLSGGESRKRKFNNFIRGIVEGEGGAFYCSTPSGIIVLNPSLQFRGLLPAITKKIPSPDLMISGSYLYYASDTYPNHGLYRFDVKTGKQTRFLNTESNEYNININLVYQLSKFNGNDLLLGTLNGLWKFETDKQRFDSLPGITMPNEQVLFSYQDRHQQVYKGMNLLGLAVYRPNGNSWKEVFRSKKKFTVKHCAEINDSLLWIGTSEGLYLFNTARLKIEKHYNTDNGLPNNVVYAIMPDLAKNLWLSTNKGLSYFNVLKNEFTNFTAEDGLQANEFNTHVALKAKDGRIIFGGVNGLTVVEPDAMRYKMRSTVLKITAVKTDSLLNPYPYNEQDAVLTLHAGINSFETELTAINFSNPGLCKIKYRLVGYDNDWHIITNPGRIWYVKLPLGKYTLEMTASNVRGEFTGDIKKLEVVVKGYWWQSTWFKIAAVLFFIVLVIFSVMFYLRYKTNRQNEKLEKQFAVQTERERIIADLHDDVGATLSSMNILGELANSAWNTKPQQSKAMLGKIADQSKDLMERMSDIVWSLKSTGEEKNSLTGRLRNYTYDLLAVKNIAVEFAVDEELATQMTNPLARKNILLIAKEAINNIAKYSQATKAFIGFRLEGKDVLLSIGDNGKGFDETVTAKGNGLGNIEQRCRQLNGQCSFESTKGNGVLLICRFPLAIISHMG